MHNQAMSHVKYVPVIQCATPSHALGQMRLSMALHLSIILHIFDRVLIYIHLSGCAMYKIIFCCLRLFANL